MILTDKFSLESASATFNDKRLHIRSSLYILYKDCKWKTNIQGKGMKIKVQSLTTFMNLQNLVLNQTG